MSVRLFRFHASPRKRPHCSHRTGLHIPLLILLPSTFLLPPLPRTAAPELPDCLPSAWRGARNPAPRPCSLGAAHRQGRGGKSGLNRQLWAGRAVRRRTVPLGRQLANRAGWKRCCLLERKARELAGPLLEHSQALGFCVFVPVCLCTNPSVGSCMWEPLLAALP